MLLIFLLLMSHCKAEEFEISDAEGMNIIFKDFNLKRKVVFQY